jgi:hypothetical protein
MSKARRQDRCHITTAILCGSINTAKNTNDDYTFHRKLVPHINAYRKHAVELNRFTTSYGWVSGAHVTTKAVFLQFNFFISELLS